MEWFEKFKVGGKVQVTRKITSWKFSNGGGCSWNSEMDATIGKVYEVKSIDEYVGYELWTEKDTYFKYNYWYPVESLAHVSVKGTQLMFAFMQTSD